MQRIYYTGDAANQPGWFTAETLITGAILLDEEGGVRMFTACPAEIGDTYEGHCNPRFVTEAAVQAYRARRFSTGSKTEKE